MTASSTLNTSRGLPSLPLVRPALSVAAAVDVHTETLLVRFDFDSLDEYVLFLKEVAAPINNLLADQTPERKSDVWGAVAEANGQFVGADGRMHGSGESILVGGRR